MSSMEDNESIEQSVEQVQEEVLADLGQASEHAQGFDADKLAEELEWKLRAHENVHGDPVLAISVIPAYSRAMDDGRYTPVHVSIGPCHWGSSQLRREAEKVPCLRSLLDRGSSREDLTSLLEKLMKQLLEDRRILECCGFDKNRPIGELVKMLLLDGCYLLTHFWWSHQSLPGGGPSPGQERTTSVHVPNEQVGCSSRDPLSTSSSSDGGQSGPPAQEQQGGNGHSASGTSRGSPGNLELQQVGRESSTSDTDEDANMAVMVRDTWYLLENQIPFVVVEKVCELTTGHTDTDGVRTAFRSYAGTLLAKQHYICTRSAPEANSSPHHLLHILHSFFKPRSGNANLHPGGTASTVVGPWRRATEYVRHGNVRFVEQPLDGTKALSVLDVGMEGGKVQLPCLKIDSNTWTILLNLRALEQQHPSLGTYVTAYCVFMSQMATTAEDVELLMRHGVLEHSLGAADNVAAGFMELCSGVVLDTDDVKRNYLKPIWLKLEKRYTSPWHNSFSWFRLNYWSWRNAPVVIAVVVGFIVLASEVMSAVFQALSYYQQEREHK